jgi:nucleoside-diphosphate kinase
VKLSAEETSDFYAEHYGKPDFSTMIAYMSKGPIVALVLAKGSETVADWLELIGPENVKKAISSAPKSIRAKYGTVERDDLQSRNAGASINLMNAVHGSDSPRSAQREIRFFFPNSIVEPLPNPDDTRDFINTKINPTLIRGLTELVKAKPNDPLRFLAGWLSSNNPNRPQVEEPDDE